MRAKIKAIWYIMTNRYWTLVSVNGHNVCIHTTKGLEKTTNDLEYVAGVIDYHTSTVKVEELLKEVGNG